MAIGFLMAMVVVLWWERPAGSTLVRAGGVFFFGNLTAASTLAALYVLDTPADQKGFGIRNLAPAGWGLVAVTGNVMAAAAIKPPPDFELLFFYPRLAAFFFGLPVFLVGWFLLSRFGFRIWRNNKS
ncbi:hypothetical protein [Novipirellula artificiosorum]|nr:hypothetical protein [Novipirellula artificiosorum]